MSYVYRNRIDIPVDFAPCPCHCACTVHLAQSTGWQLSDKMDRKHAERGTAHVWAVTVQGQCRPLYGQQRSDRRNSVSKFCELGAWLPLAHRSPCPVRTAALPNRR